jgi:hypothetical protein
LPGKFLDLLILIPANQLFDNPPLNRGSCAGRKPDLSTARGAKRSAAWQLMTVRPSAWGRSVPDEFAKRPGHFNFRPPDLLPLGGL